MKFCYCGQPSFGKDKTTNTPYCKSHQYMRSDIDKRSIVEKAMDKEKKRKALVSDGAKLRGLVGKGENDLLHSRNNLINELDFYTSRIVRLMASDDLGYAVCYCCGKKDRWQDMDNAHFVSRGSLALRFDIKYNCRANCKTCNQFKGGNLERYAEELKKEFGENIIEELHERGREVWKPSNDELSQMLSDYKQRLKILETKIKTLNANR